MSNDYYTTPAVIVDGTRATGADVNNVSSAAEVAFAKLPNPDKLKQGRHLVLTQGGTANALTFTTGLSLGSYEIGTEIQFLATTTNTGATTVTVDGGSTLAVTLNDGTALPANTIVTGRWYKIKYDGSKWPLNATDASASATAAAASASAAAVSASDASDSADAAAVSASDASDSADAAAASAASAVPLWSNDFRTALVVSNNSSDSEHDLDISAGSTLDPEDLSGAYYMRLLGGTTKRMDATFALGTGNGMLSDQNDSGVVQANTWYGVFLLSKTTDSDDSDVIGAKSRAAALADTVVVANGFNMARLIDVVRTDASGNIINWVDGGDGWRLWKTGQIEATNTPSSGGASVAVSVPPNMIGRVNYLITAGSATAVSSGFGLLTNLNQTNETPTSDNFSVGTGVTAIGSGATSTSSSGSVVVDVRVSSSSTIRHRESSAVSSMQLNTVGWKFLQNVLDL